jgi:DNA-binding beta-propeller fold protein YncE
MKRITYIFLAIISFFLVSGHHPALADEGPFVLESTISLSDGAHPVAINVDSANHLAYVVAQNPNELYIINSITNEIINNISLASTPTNLALDLIDNRVYILNNSANTVTVVDLNTFSQQTISGFQNPTAIAVNEITNKAYVTNDLGASSYGFISIIDANSNSVVGTVTVGISPSSIDVSTLTNKIYVSSSTNQPAALGEIDGDTLNTNFINWRQWTGHVEIDYNVYPVGSFTYLKVDSTSGNDIVYMLENDGVMKAYFMNIINDDITNFFGYKWFYSFAAGWYRYCDGCNYYRVTTATFALDPSIYQFLTQNLQYDSNGITLFAADTREAVDQSTYGRPPYQSWFTLEPSLFNDVATFPDFDVIIHKAFFPRYDSSTIAVVRKPPITVNISGANINEGQTYTANGYFSDTDSNFYPTSWTATVDYGDGDGPQTLLLDGTNFLLNHLYEDNGFYRVTVSVTNNLGGHGSAGANVLVNNVPPTVSQITAPSDPITVNNSITSSSTFSDPGVLDTHTAVWDWGDGTTSNGTVTESNGSGSVQDSRT